MNEQSLNLNQADCLKAINNFGSTTYQNVCNGTSSVVPWGGADFIIAMFLLVMLAFVVWVIGYLIKNF